MIALTFATLGWWLAQPTQAYAADTTNCPAIQHPEETNVKYKLTFDQHHPDFVEVRQVTRIEVPERQWAPANNLTLSTDSPKHRNAMHCLLREDRKAQTKSSEWHPEWRTTGSPATKQKGVVAVQYESWNLINSPGEFEVGPWDLKVAPGEDWKAVLHSPDALSRVPRKTIEIDPGGLEISDAPGASSANEASRVWIAHGPDSEAKIVPPQHLAPALSRHAPWVGSLGVVSWWVCASAVIALSAWPFLGKKTAGEPENAAARVLATTVLQWAGLSAALGLTLLLLLQPSPSANRWRALIGISSGLALVLLARPWLPSAQGSDEIKKGTKRRTVVVATVSAAAVIGLLVIIAPHLFGLPPNLMPTTQPPPLGIAGLALLDMSMLWLWFTAMAAWAWRFTREGRLGEASITTESEHRLRNITAIGVILAAAAVAVVGCRVLSFELRWERANWMGEASTIFGHDHRSALSQQLVQLSSAGPTWAYAHTWVLSGIALVALLHSSYRLNPKKTLGPEGWDLLLVTGIFAVAVALRGTKFAGSSSAVYGFWLPLNMVVLYATVKAGNRWSVLGRVGQKAANCLTVKKEENCVVAELSTSAGYRQLMEDARRCRDLLRRLHLVDQGREEKTTRRNLEKQLRSLHHWRPSGCSRDCLPDPVSVVDVALSWGPGRHWWNNALKAARWASIFGILPSMVTAWYENAYDIEHWTFTLNSSMGIPDMVGKFLTQEISFAGAGLVLGALWRVLPGERGPVRAFNLFIAWLVPIGLVAALNHGIDRRELALAVLNVVLMLMVLTLTSMWMDTDTFSRERHYWTKRLGLLTSIYQVHGLSGQIAFLTLQAATAVTIWHQIVTM
ncbi:DUF6185 family protein [Streptomyces griseocarneus]|uniref:DUF6185 family protein n=1 Tax=Streptomyces griseocarneus TaxID=51201 RepID=UPI00167E6FB3|nr:DUF6185 family protein [Streptomyces griseocarneus]MBZ6475299.1 DUF6185 family protein [Streptomyces griseocarneus]